MNFVICRNSAERAAAVAGLPVQGPLPARLVLVPRERVAHDLRRALAGASPAALAGTRFLSMADAAAAVLHEAGVAFHTGEEALRPGRLLALFPTLHLQCFDTALLLDKIGWDEAFAATIADLEGAALRPDDLEEAASPPQVRDLAAVWRAADASAGASWSEPRVFLEAAAALEADAAVWPFAGVPVAFVAADVPAATARFLRAIPQLVLGIPMIRPRGRLVDRMRTLFGADVGDALRAARPPADTARERDLVARYLFEPPETLLHPGRPASAGPDGTVDLEEHAGIEEELEAAVDWVARQVLDGVPLDGIAVLVPSLDPLGGQVAQRLARLPWGTGSMPVHVAGGLPLRDTAAGARALAVLRALRGWLGAEVLADVLPVLRWQVEGVERTHLSHGDAVDVAWSLGTTGGSAARREGALDWSGRAAQQEGAVEHALQRALRELDADSRDGRRTIRALERRLQNLRGIRPALDALVGVARLAVEGAPLVALWPVLRAFMVGWLLQPAEGMRAETALDERVPRMAEDGACGTLRGDDALRVVEEALDSLRISSGRFGEPAVYVGAVRDADGLRFQAVRVMGLVEGHFPSAPREDPVLPDRERERLGAAKGAERVQADLQALDAILRDAERIALSAAHFDLQGSQREPSPICMEVAAALRRPDAAGTKLIPDLAALRRTAFGPARQAAEAFRVEAPIGETAWHDRVARHPGTLPTSWRHGGALDLARIQAMRSTTADAQAEDGILGGAVAGIAIPGLSAERPISASGLAALLGCPYAFLLGTVLGLDEPAERPTLHEIGQPHYGNLFHQVAADFYRAHGAAFSSRTRDLAAWRDEAAAMVDVAFDELLEQYPLVGEAVRRRERQRLHRDVRAFVEHDWATKGHRYFDAERAFGPLEIAVEGHRLFLGGRIDRIDVSADRTLLRDFKTGRPHPRVGREADPCLGVDLQIGLYGIVIASMAQAWGVPSAVAVAYTYVSRGAVGAREFRLDFPTLETATRSWLAVAAPLLQGGLFPRTPQADDCKDCAFKPVCGDAATERAVAIATTRDDLASFAALKGIALQEEGRDASG